MPIHPHKMKLSCKSKLYSSLVFKQFESAWLLILLLSTITCTIIKLNHNLINYHAVRISYFLIVPLYLPRPISSNHDCVYSFILRIPQIPPSHSADTHSHRHEVEVHLSSYFTPSLYNSDISILLPWWL